MPVTKRPATAGANTGKKPMPNLSNTRARRTMDRLTRAALEMAAERDVASASVAELARRAGVDRSTFYEYAESPLDLVARILREDLDVVRTEHLEKLAKSSAAFSDIVRGGLDRIIDHVLKFENIYSSGSQTSFAALRMVLGDNLAQSVKAMFEEGPALPFAEGDPAWGLHAASIAHGIAAAIHEWLNQPAPRSRDLIIAVCIANIPQWYRDQFVRPTT